MNRSTIYTVADGTLTAMAPAAPENEDTMQRLVADHPEIITDEDGELLLIRREQPIGDGEAGSRWSLDHLFVTRSAIPVLVELKRAVDTRLRREVVGQMLDYAANATAHWQAGTIAASFAATNAKAGRNPEELLSDFLGPDEDPSSFWQQVDANFSAGRVKLVFVADVIPRELARIVEFLNDQMKADVRAVELNWFEGGGVKAFAPRIIGRTERAQAVKGAAAPLDPVTQEQWIDAHLSRHGSDTVTGAQHFAALVERAGGHAEVPMKQGSIVATFDVPGGRLYPMSVTKHGNVQFSLFYLKSRSAFAAEEARQAMYDRLVGIVGPLSSGSISGFPSFRAELLNDPEIRAKVEQLLRDTADAVREAS